MKRILITGADSYIGTSLEYWLLKYDMQYSVETVNTKSEMWRNQDFGLYDVIFHVAGIAHADTGNVTEAEKKRYYQVNCELAYKVAKKAKEERVKQFIFMSSMSVYGEAIGARNYRITHNTTPNPCNFYGNSKLQAEKRLAILEDDSFRVVILRPPMIYGKNSKGNYPILSKIARKAPIFPDINNCRSMLYIDNLCEFIRLIIDNQEKGVFFPQNKEYVKTTEMVRLIALRYDRRIILIPGFDWLIYLLGRIPGKIGRLTGKAFGSIQYDMNMSEYKMDYRVSDFKDSIRCTER